MAVRAVPSLMIGGQAVLEGVMMRSPRFVSVAVRRPSGELLTETLSAPSLLFRHRFGLPIVRGVAALYDAVVLGARAIMFSANAALPQERRPLTGRDVGLSLAAGLALSLGLFFVLPTLLARMAEAYLASSLALNAAEGGFRIVLVIGYIAVIGRISDLSRVYQYHGAEHKTVNAFEAGLPLEVAAVRGCSRFHPRCGTSFILVVLLASVAVFAFLGRPPLPVRVAERLLLLPVIAGASYEIIRLAGRSAAFRPLVLPGMWLQRLTTREPDDAQLEVAIRALREVVDAEVRPERVPSVV